MITPGELRARTQPTILLRMTDQVMPAPGNTDGDAAPVFGHGVIVFAQYIGNGRLFLDPIVKGDGHRGHVVMASALNSTAQILTDTDLNAIDAYGSRPVTPPRPGTPGTTDY